MSNYVENLTSTQIIFTNFYYLITSYHALQVTFHYVGYNESGRRIDSTYLQGSPAKIRMGSKALVPGKKGRIDLVLSVVIAEHMTKSFRHWLAFIFLHIF